MHTDLVSIIDMCWNNSGPVLRTERHKAYLLRGLQNLSESYEVTECCFIATRRYTSVVYAMALCLSVCLCASQVGVLLKWLDGLS